MNPNVPQNPNLTSILQTLAAFTPRQPTVPPESGLEEGEYDPREDALDFHHHMRDVPPAPVSERPPAPPSTINSLSTLNPAPSPSPSGITTWPKALNYIVQYIFSDPNKKRRIGYLIQTQHRHEREWWASREELIRKTQGRKESRMQLDSVLASVGGLVATSSRLQGEAQGDDVSKELAVFDRKVYHAYRQMIDATKKELFDLGVPFYCAGDIDKIDKKELETLRQRMLQLLEDYCGSEDLEG